MKEIEVAVGLDAVWRKAEVDFQTFQLSRGIRDELIDLSEALSVEPDLFSNEWYYRAAKLISALGVVREMEVRADSFRVVILVPGNVPDGIAGTVNALAEAYFVRCLLGAWNELRHDCNLYDWRSGAEELLDRIGEILNSGTGMTVAGRRISAVP